MKFNLRFLRDLYRRKNGSPLDQMHPARRIHNTTNLPGLQRKRSLLKLLLHFSWSKEPPVSNLAFRRES